MTLLTSSGYVHVVGGRSRPPETLGNTLLLGKFLAFMKRRAIQFRVLARDEGALARLAVAKRQSWHPVECLAVAQKGRLEEQTSP